MKLKVPILCLFFLQILSQKPLKLSRSSQMSQLSPSSNIPSIHPEDNWMYGGLAPPLPPIYDPPITTSYEEMLSNPKKRMISMGVNNSGIIDLNKTVVIDAEPKFIYEEDGVQGTLAPVRKPAKKLPLTEQYEEMLKDSDKRLISLGVNTTAFYDPDNQVILEGTEQASPLDVMGKSLEDIQEENRNTKKKMARFLEDSPRFEQKSESMSYANKYPTDKELINNLSDKLKDIDESGLKPLSNFRFNNIKANTEDENVQIVDSYQNSEPAYNEVENPRFYASYSQPDPEPIKTNTIKPENKEKVKTSLEKLSQQISREINKDMKKKSTSLKLKKNTKHHQKTMRFPIEATPNAINIQGNEQETKVANSLNDNNELSINYQFNDIQESQELQTIGNLIKNGEKDQEAASKRLSILKSLLKSQENKEISTKEVIFSELRGKIQRMKEDLSRKENEKIMFDLEEMKNFLKKRNVDKKFRSKFKEIIQDITEKDMPKKNDENVDRSLALMLQMTENKQKKIDNKGLKYSEVAEKLENTENQVEKGKLYEAEESLNEINDLLRQKA